jgi:hypothetical protein
VDLLSNDLFTQIVFEELVLHDCSDHFTHLCDSDSQVSVSVFKQIISDFPRVLIWELSMINTNLIMTVLNRYHNISMRCKPSTYAAVCVHVCAKAVAENDDLELFLFVVGIEVNRGVRLTGHGDFGEE